MNRKTWFEEKKETKRAWFEENKETQSFYVNDGNECIHVIIFPCFTFWVHFSNLEKKLGILVIEVIF